MDFIRLDTLKAGGTFLESKNSSQRILAALNKEFLVEHHKTAKQALSRINNVMVYKEDILSLWLNHNNGFQKINEKQVIRDQYTHIKQIVHVPVYIETLLHTTSPRNHAKKLLELKQLQNKLLLASKKLPDTKDKIILQKSIGVISELCDNNISEYSFLLKKYLNEIANEVEDVCAQATSIQIKDSLDRVTRQWISDYKINMEASRVLIVGTHGPKEGRIEMQYYEALYNHYHMKNVENDKLYYVESLAKHIPSIDIQKDLIEEFLAKEELNKIYGVSRYGNCKWMSGDVLSKHAGSSVHGLFAGMKTMKCPLAALKIPRLAALVTPFFKGGK